MNDRNDGAALEPQTFRERQIAYWRNEARENWLLGFMDLARVCERFATNWEFGDEYCGN